MKHLFAGLFLSLAACSGQKEKESALASAETWQVKDAPRIIADQSSPDSLKGSLRAMAEGVIGSAKVTVQYHSPAVRGRIIWGGLVPNNQVWVTGAHMATSVEFSQDVTIAGKLVAAGKYGFFTIPGEEAWTLIINQDWDQHLADEYDEKKDVVRYTTNPSRRDILQERLQYTIVPDDASSGRLVVRWDKLEVALPIRVGR